MTEDRRALARLVAEIRACRVCEAALPHGVRPVLRVDPRARVALVGQAPGARVHETGVPFTDPSGVRLRSWLGVSEAQFYDPAQFAVVPAGFCFPGYTDRGADKPPRPECAPLWHDRVFALLPRLRLIVLAGAYAHRRQLGAKAKRTVSETVQSWREVAPLYAPLPHPSWRNNTWIARNPWFTEELLPDLQKRVAAALSAD